MSKEKELVRELAKVKIAAMPPMMQHYAQTKLQYPHAILLYRMGDFYETFFEDAEIVSRELELVLTGKEAGKEVGRVAMAGIPYHALDRYARQLVEKGYAVAVCEQMELAENAKGLVRREVTQVITPGTAIAEELLTAQKNNYLTAVINMGSLWGLAYADVSTGEFYTTQVHDRETLILELQRLQPAEVLLPVETPKGNLFRQRHFQSLPEAYQGLPPFCYTEVPQHTFALATAQQKILEVFQVRSLEGFGCAHLPLAIRAAGGLLEYLADTQKQIQVPLRNLSTYTITDYLILDVTTRRNLEVVQTVRDGTFHGSLLWALDRCMTSMGSRTLRRWLLQPLKDIPQIEERLESVSELVKNHDLRKRLRNALKEVYDVERLCSKVGAGTANAREVLAIAQSIGKSRDISHLVSECSSPYLKVLQYLDPQILALGDRLLRTLNEELPILITEGNLIRTGVNPQLDQLRSQQQQDLQWLANYERQERDKWNIPTLKLGFNKAFGYYISISKGKSQQAPSNYIRKQTLTTEERYTTAELKQKEQELENIQKELYELEYDLFLELRQAVQGLISPLRVLAQNLANLDALGSLAEVAVTYNYTRPTLTTDRTIAITNGRHPVVEQTLPMGFFVPNSVNLGYGDQPDLIILTGPNMSGKSTYLRQIGIIQLMAQVGSFVPAESCKVGICDRLFTRVGAVDDLAMGQSTFMVEMNETANILNHAKPTSLVLLDEIGRGTSTFDGMAIAWAVAEYLATEIGCRTIFATHYHELNQLAKILKNVANFQVTVKELGDEIIFLHQVQAGGADRSYGIEVGRLAGLPKPVIARAKQVLEQIDRHSSISWGEINWSGTNTD
ncbi:MAG: DNA mismatch repair protein MutS [Pseudanabaenaceae cyanobacterium]